MFLRRLCPPAGGYVELECCWFNQVRSPRDCPNIGEGEEELYTSPRRRLVEKCLECAAFQRDIDALAASGHPSGELMGILRDEVLEQKGHLQALAGFLSSKTREIKFLHELSVVLQTSLELDEVLSVAMTAITSGKGFGMNRAFLLMAEREQQRLRGYLAVGPRNYEEAWQIWSEVDRHNFSLRELARHFQRTKLSSEKAKFHDILEQLTISYTDEAHILNRALRERKPVLVTDAFHNPEVDPSLARILGVDSFLVMPLISRNRRIGILIADNFVTHRSITPHDLQSLETFAFPVAFAIERASLYEKLHEQVEQQTAANLKMQEQQELIVKMEKMAVVGRVTSSIAHSIRNPLMAIGGYARSLLKNLDNLEHKREYLEYIVREAKQLEDVLEEVLNYSDSLYPVMDRWDLNQLVRNVCRELDGKLAGRQIAVVQSLDPDLPTVYLDYKQIAYCLRTVIAHMTENQPGVDRIELRTAANDVDTVTVTLCDNGTPMTPEVKEALTTPFTGTHELGLGVGLPLCRIILEKHGSSFVIEDRPGGGTCYSITLPQGKENP
jgi:signal transduction histidine kinase